MSKSIKVCSFFISSKSIISIYYNIYIKIDYINMAKRHNITFNTEAEYLAFKASSDYSTPNVSYVGENNEVHYNPYDYPDRYLTFTATESGTFKFSNAASYSLDDGATWTSLAANTNTPTVTAGSKILWKANITPQAYVGVGTFSGGTCDFYVEGNAMSLIYGDNFIGKTTFPTSEGFCGFVQLFYGNTHIINAKNLCLPTTTLVTGCYSSMFYGCTSLTTAPELLATTLAYSCYYSMFQGCTSLTTAPELPATTLASSCYATMFYNCTSLTTAPELPATTLASSCYATMFYNCTSLNSIKCLATNISASNCTYGWVSGVASSGTFTKAASMSSWTIGANGIPSNWTVTTASA